MVARTFERFLREQKGLGYEDFYNLMPIVEGEIEIKKMFRKWIEKEKPTESWQMVAKWNCEKFGWEI